MSFIDLASKIRVRCGRKKSGTPTLYSQPGAHTGNTRQYIPGYSDSNIVYLDTASGNDANSGATELLPKLTYSSAATAAGSTKKIRVINDGAALSTNITKPTEMKRGVSGTISSSLTAPVDTWTQAATPSFGTSDVNCVTWAAGLSKFIAGGGSGKIAYSSDGSIWTQAASTPFGSNSVLGVCYSEPLKLAIAIGAQGVAAKSTDLQTWTQVGANIFPSTNLNNVIYSERLGVFVIVSGSGISARSIFISDDGETWESATDSTFPSDTIDDICDGPDRLVAVSSTGGKIAYSFDGYTWTQAATPSFGGSGVLGVVYSKAISKYIACGFTKIAYSSDGNTWTQAATPSFGASAIYRPAHIPELGSVVVGGASGKIAYSSDADTWTQSATTTMGAEFVKSAAYSPFLGKAVAVASTGKIAYSTAFANTISAAIAGFTVQAVQYSGTVTAYNCTMKQPGTTAALSLNACRLTESGAHISNNAQSHFGTLVEGNFNITCTPASQNAVAINCNTIAGRLSIFNASSTLYEQIRDNIIDGGFYASSACLIQSGNLRGTYTNATLSSKVSNGQDPVFVDETDYKIKRITNGDSQDSPLCNAALYYVNEAGYDRDVGAWSYDDTENATEYQRTFYLNKPAGNGISITKLQSANAYQGDSGGWDSYNNPARASEHLTLTYQSAVPVDHIDFQDYFETLDDMTCEVNLDPQNDSPSTAFTVNGNHAIGDVVLNIDASTTIRGGVHFTTGGNTYYAVYVTPAGNATKIILDRPLVAAIADNTSITPASVAGDGEYQYLPQNRDGKRPMGQETEYLGGCVFKFVRPWQ